MGSGGMKMNRRQFGKLSAAAFLLGPLVGTNVSLAANPTGVRLHGLSAFGELPLPPDFPHFSYVNPDAPKGGTFNFSVPNWVFNQNPQTFDTLNTFVLKGAAPPRLELVFDTLMARDFNDPSALYGLLARDVEISEDRNTYRFRLRPEARWHDGSPVTARDVAFTFTTFKADGHPQITAALIDLESANALDDETVELVFNGEQSDRAVLTVVAFPIISQTFYTANSFLETTIAPPLGSGPYKVGRINAGTFIEYDRVADYWAKDLGVRKGMANFDTLRIEFYKERQAAFEAFKKGEIDYRQEFTSATWATKYDFPAVAEGKVVQRLFDSEKIPSIQGWAVNTRLKKFSDPRTVQAIGHCFDFEWTNRNLFYDSYARGGSFFQNSEFAASGAPTPEELALLEPLRADLPEDVFGAVSLPPVSDGSGRDRNLLRRATELFKKAGWTRQGNALVDADGEALTIEFLIRSPTFERILSRFVENLKLVGVEATIRLVDPSQFQQRLETFDFDIVGRAMRLTALPTSDSLQQMFGSKSADQPGSFNIAGIRSKAADALIKKAGEAENREDLAVILRALDRVLRATHTWIPNWYSANHRVAYWDMVEFPERKADYDFSPELIWWHNPDKAKAIGRG